MCTYSFQQMVCCCAKGAACPQKTRGQAVIGGELYHLIDMYHAIVDLGAACEYQRRIFGRTAPPTMHCPRYGFDEKRLIRGQFRMSELACVKCAETCAPPSTGWQAPGPGDRDVNGLGNGSGNGNGNVIGNGDLNGNLHLNGIVNGNGVRGG